MRREPSRRYEGFFADSSRWERFELREGDVVITTPSKCGTTWMQHLVGMMLLRRADLGVPISELSPWLDMRTRTEREVFAQLERQRHRRFIKTHTPLDGLPVDDRVDYVTIVRHPLDVALSDRDHRANTDLARAHDLLRRATGSVPAVPAERLAEPDDVVEYLRWFVDNDLEPVGSGPYGLADFCQQVSTYWAARSLPNVHLFHYSDLTRDIEGEARAVAQAIGVEVEDGSWDELLAAVDFRSMRRAAARTAPEADRGLWHRPDEFFRHGGDRHAESLLPPGDRRHFRRRLDDLAGGAAAWVLGGRRAL